MQDGDVSDPGKFNLRLLKVMAIVLLATLIVAGSEVFLLLFAGILFGVFLRSLANELSCRVHTPPGLSLTIVVLALLGISVGSYYLIAPSVATQVEELTTAIPKGIQKIEALLGRVDMADEVSSSDLGDKLLSGSGQLVSKAGGLISGTLGWLANGFIIFFLGLYLAVEPETYRTGFSRLVPVRNRARALEVLSELNETLKWWLIGKVFAMLVIGVFTTIGLWFLDVPIALTLGVIAAALTFIPNIGPILAAVPAILLGLVDSPTKALYVTLLYVAIQTVESYLLTPLIQRKTVSLPPALTLAAQILLSVLFGILGLALATPLMAAILVLTRMLYVEDLLGDVPCSGMRESS